MFYVSCYMKLVVGLGNPGSKYLKNRHNVGHMFVDYANKQILNTKFIKTNVFMNQSGAFVKKLIRHSSLDISHLVIVHDDLDIPLGKYKIQLGSGPKLHNGILSIEEALGTKNFRRIRVGIDNRLRDSGLPFEALAKAGEKYVLQDFTHEERKILLETFDEIMNRLTRGFLL